MVHITETTTERRATLQSLAGPIILLGSLISFILCHFMYYWRHTVFLLECFSLICCVSLFHIPESPIWLISKNHYEEASRSLKWLRATEGSADLELLELYNAKMQCQRSDLSLNKKIIASKAWKPFLTLLVFFFLQHFTGYHIIFNYAANFLELLEFHTSVDASALAYVIFSMVPSVLFSAFVDKYDRRALATLSTVGVCIACTMITMYEFTFQGFKEKPTLVSFDLFNRKHRFRISWTVFTAVGNGRRDVPYTSTRYYDQYTVDCRLLLPFNFAQNVPVNCVPFIRIQRGFMIFSLVAFIAIIFTIFVLPESETRGKTLLEIEAREEMLATNHLKVIEVELESRKCKLSSAAEVANSSKADCRLDE